MKMEELIAHHEKVAREQGLEQGKTLGILQGKAETVISFLVDKGDITPEIREQIENEKDEKKLNAWIKQSALCETVEEFINQM